MNQPIILNFDNSVGEIANSLTFDFTAWQEKIRFGCSMTQYRIFSEVLNQQLPNTLGPVLVGSGDYHHISLILIERLRLYFSNKQQIQIIIFDNHPDNMRYLFGIHCGSWVSHIASLPFVSHIHVLGITSNDIGLSHAWENRLSLLLKNKLTYWCMDVNVSWAKTIGLQNSFLRFSSPDKLITAFIAEQCNDNNQLAYLSIDKDVLSEEIIKTNWDQGKLKPYHLFDVISALRGRIVGSDICGEISNYQYHSRFKRFLSKLDHQPTMAEDKLYEYQLEQQKINQQLIPYLIENHISNKVIV